MNPPLEQAPEGEWKCPAHRPGRRKGTAEHAASEADSTRSSGMRHKPARVDQNKYQVACPPQLTDHERKADYASDRASLAGWAVWQPQRCDEDDLLELYCFCNSLARGKYRSELSFYEDVRTHLHLCDYSLTLACYMLQAAAEKLRLVTPEEWAYLEAEGHQYGEVLLATLENARYRAMPPLDAPLKGANTIWGVARRESVNLPKAAAQLTLDELSLPNEEAMLASIRGKQLEWQEAQAAQVDAWLAYVQSVLSADSIELQRLVELVDMGAKACDVRLEHLSRRSSVRHAGLQKLAQLNSQVKQATSWRAKVADAGLSQSPELLASLLEEARPFPFSLREVGELSSRVERISAWLEQARQMIGQRCELREIQELLREAEQIGIKSPEVEALRHRSQAGKRWVAQIHNDLLRRVSSRTTAGSKLTVAEVEALLEQAEEMLLDAVEINQAQERLDELRRWREQAQALLEPVAQSVNEKVFEELEEMIRRAEELNMAIPELNALDERLMAVKSWLARASAILNGRNSDLNEVNKVIKDANQMRIELPELPKLVKQQREKAWLDSAEDAINGPASLVTLKTLLDSAHTITEGHKADGKYSDLTKALENKLSLASKWVERLDSFLAGRPTLRDIVSIISEADAAGLVMDETARLKRSISRCKAWQDRARKAQSRATRGSATQPTLEELRALLDEGLKLPLSVPEEAVIAMHVREAEDWCQRASALLATPMDVPEMDWDQLKLSQEQVSKRSTSGKTSTKPDSDVTQELMEQGKTLTVQVGFMKALEIRSWRQRCQETLVDEPSLSELQDLCEEAETIGIALRAKHVTLPSSSDAAVSNEVVHTEPKQGHLRSSGPPLTDEQVAMKQEEEKHIAAELECAHKQYGQLDSLLYTVRRWKERAEAVLTTERVELQEMETLLWQGDVFPIAMDEYKWLETSIEDARAWLRVADELEAPSAKLEEVHKHIKAYAKINLKSHRVEAFKIRAAQGDAWLDALKRMYKTCGIELPSLQLILSTDGEEIYCVCRQPDDGQRLMISCDRCFLWYHNHCIGIPPAKAKLLENEGSNFMCPACSVKQGVKFPYEVRVTKPPIKQLPSARQVAGLLRRADSLMLRVEEERLLREAFRKCREWQKNQLPKVMKTDWRSLGDDELSELIDAGERFRVECELMAVLKGWRWLRQLHQLESDGVITATARLPTHSLEELEASLACAKEERLGDEADAFDEDARQLKIEMEQDATDGGCGLTNGAAESRLSLEGETGSDQAFTPQMVQWLKAQLELLRSERQRLMQAIAEARSWEEEATRRCLGLTACDPVELRAFVERGRASTLNLVSLPRLLDRAAQLDAWEAETKKMFSASNTAATPHSSAEDLVRRPSVKDAIALERKGSVLCAIGSTWEQLLRKLNACAIAVGEVRNALVDYSGVARLHAAVAQLEGLGLGMDEVTTLKMQMIPKLQSERQNIQIPAARSVSNLDPAQMRPQLVGQTPVPSKLEDNTKGHSLVQLGRAEIGGSSSASAYPGGGTSTPFSSADFSCSETLQPVDTSAVPVGTAKAAHSSCPNTDALFHPIPMGLTATQLIGMGLQPQTLNLCQTAQLQGSQPKAANQFTAMPNTAAQRVMETSPPPPVVGLHGLGRNHVIGSPIRVYYVESEKLVGYNGSVDGFDAKRGLRVRLDGFQKREWVTDEDEWEWLDGAGSPQGPRPLELVVGHAALRDMLAKLNSMKESLLQAAKGEHQPDKQPSRASTKRKNESGVSQPGGKRPNTASSKAGTGKLKNNRSDSEVAVSQATKRKSPTPNDSSAKLPKECSHTASGIEPKSNTTKARNDSNEGPDKVLSTVSVGV